MNPQDVCDKLEVIGATISGVESAYSEPPLNLDTAKLPCFYPLMGAATYEELGGDFCTEERQYRCQVAIAPVAEAKPDLIEKRARVLVPLTRDALLKYAALNSLSDAPLQVTVSSDTGVRVLPEYGGTYIGFEFSITVQTVFARSYAAGE